METASGLRAEIRKMLVDNLMLQIPADEIGDDQALFGPGSIGLDSVDALQLVVALDKNYGLKIADPEAAKKTLQSVNSMAAAVEEKRHGN
jgi:acyl carrier protein